MSELTSQDTYQVYCKGFLSADKVRVLTLLYQPLCRAQAFSLYLTLYYEAENARSLKAVSTHYRLLSMTQLDLQTLSDCLLCLEGLGLIRTYQKMEGDNADYIYEVLMPLTPKRFFDNALLSTLLCQTLGEIDFDKTKYAFTCQALDTKQYQPVSHRFDEVFHVQLNEKKVLKMQTSLADDQRKEPTIRYDMDMFYRGLQDYQIPRSAITPEIEKAIVQYGTLYHIAPSLMRELVYDVYDQGKIALDDLKERCRRYYAFESQTTRQAVMQPATTITQPAESLREQKIQQLSTLSPYAYLSALQNGTKPTARDLSLIENVLVNQKLNPGVVNVLIETVLQLNHGQLPRNHLEYLAGLFARKGVSTVEEAMTEARQYISEKKQTGIIMAEPKRKLGKTIETVDEKEVDALKKEIEAMLKGDQSA